MPKKDWQVGVKPTREEIAAQQERDKEQEDHVLKVLNEVFGLYEEDKRASG